MNTSKLPPLVAIVGPTAVGKTALAIDLAQRINGEIINADSRQIYRGMDIGTAKPTPAEQGAAPHHLVDLLDPDEPFSLAVYHELASRTIHDVRERGHVPMLVGGTGQYVVAVVEGWQIPRVPPQPEIRSRLEAEGTPVLYARLAAVDPAAAAKIEPSNTRRIIRALEVYETTGIPISAQQTKMPPPYPIRALWLTLDRPALYGRIDARVDAMMRAGLLDEVAGLLERGYDWDLPAMSSLGYKEFQPYFAGEQPLESCVERLKFNTHAFVRKQEMWFRRLPHTIRIAMNGGDPLQQALVAISSQ